MSSSRITALVTLTVVAGMWGSWPATAEPVGRIRPQGATLEAAVREATVRSATFRELVAAIDESDGIVYLEQGSCGHGVRSCLVAVTSAGASRILRITLDPRKAGWDLMGSIGHELQHAVEVLSHPRVRSTSAMLLYYEGMGMGRRGTGTTFETRAAMRVGEAVRGEVGRRNMAGQAR